MATPTSPSQSEPLTPTCVWRADAELICDLATRLGGPDDGYVNGSQVWLRESGVVTLEWRLHPVADFAGSASRTGLTAAPGAHHELFATVATVLAADPSAIDIALLWDGLECFPAYGDEIEPATLAHEAAGALGRQPDSFGLVNHTAIGDAWERSHGAVSIVELLVDQLNGGGPAHTPDA